MYNKLIFQFLLLLRFQSITSTKYYGSIHNQNYIWAGAMNLAWNQLKSKVIHQPITLKTDNLTIMSIVQGFNSQPFSSKDISQKDYYARAGYGMQTVKQINNEMKIKFPQNSFGEIKVDLNDSDIISYAYLFKKVKYPIKFNPLIDFKFNGKKVKGFQAKNMDQKRIVIVREYMDDENFIIQLKTQDRNTELLILKLNQNLDIQSVINRVSDLGHYGSLEKEDKCSIPNLHIDVERQYKQMLGIKLKNKGFQQYSISVMKEKIKFDMDEVGVKVQNQAIIIATRSAILNPKQPRNFIVDKSFWIVMKERNKHPYFVAYIQNI